MEAQSLVPWLTRRIACLLATILLAAGGCRKSATVTGNITYKGRGVTYGSVIFVGSDKAAHSTAIQPDGTYTLEDLAPGTFNVAVISRDPSQGRSILRYRKPVSPGDPRATGYAAPAAAAWFPLPKQFESPLTSGYNCTLSAGQVTHDIDLK
jgi:hypothetical protein